MIMWHLLISFHATYLKKSKVELMMQNVFCIKRFSKEKISLKKFKSCLKNTVRRLAIDFHSLSFPDLINASWGWLTCCALEQVTTLQNKTYDLSNSTSYRRRKNIDEKYLPSADFTDPLKDVCLLFRGW